MTEEKKLEQELAEKLVGKTIPQRRGVLKIISLHKDFFHVEYENGNDDMVRCEGVIDEYLFMKNLEENDPVKDFSDMFKEKGLIEHWTGDYVSGVAESMFGKGDGGCSLDTRTIKIYFNTTDWNFDIEIQAGGYSYCHTLKHDDSKNCGLYLKDGGNEIELDNVKWVSIEDAHENLLKEFETEFDKATKMKTGEDVYYAEPTKGDAIFTFWQDGVERAWRLRELEEEVSWLKNGYIFDVGLIKDNGKSKTAQSGRRASWGHKFTLPKKNIRIPYQEVKQKVLDLIEPKILKALTYTMKEKEEASKK